MFAESELILNPTGTIYHLDLYPENIADTIITVGDPDRVESVSRYFDKIEFKQRKREFLTHTGYLKGKRLTVISTGIGTDNIDIVMNELDALVNIDFSTREIKTPLRSLDIIRLGTSGALQEDIVVDSFLVSTFGIGLDVLLNFYKRKLSEAEEHLLTAFLTHMHAYLLDFKPYIASGSNKLISLFNKKCQEGVTVTCPGFFGPQARCLRTPLAYPHLLDDLQAFSFQKQRITNFEMETAGIYGLGQLLHHHCCSLNVIINNRIAKKFSQDVNKSLNLLIQFALEKITSI